MTAQILDGNLLAGSLVCPQTGKTIDTTQPARIHMVLFMPAVYRILARRDTFFLATADGLRAGVLGVS